MVRTGGAHGHGAGVFNTKEHKERRDRMDRNTKIFCVFKDAGNGARRRGAAAGRGGGDGMLSRAPRRWRGGAMGTSRPTATGPHHGARARGHGNEARRRDGDIAPYRNGTAPRGTATGYGREVVVGGFGARRRDR